MAEKRRKEEEALLLGIGALTLLYFISKGIAPPPPTGAKKIELIGVSVI
ncbi:MAG: hypothetical protein NC827_05975 [Candidatus Omnitrophica bacterium]|nr:hypothetical protein [Candidatus Omnitrophota bacterium]